MSSRLPPKICPQCQQSFQPKRGKQTYCSHTCVSLAATAAYRALLAAGNDPTHGGAAKAARQAALAKRRAAGEPLGWQLRKARQHGLLVSQPAATVTMARGDESLAAAYCAMHDEQERIQTPVPSQPDSMIQRPLPDEAGMQDNQTPADQPPLTQATLRAMQAAYAISGARYERKVAQYEHHQDTEPVLILAGYGACLKVKHQALVVFPGKTHAQQQAQARTYYRGMERPAQILFLKEMPGSISLDALVWCKEQGISLHILDVQAQVTQTMPAGSKEDVLLRRKQYQATNEQQAQIACLILEKKLEAQQETIRQFFPYAQPALDALHAALSWLRLPNKPAWLFDLNRLRLIEASAAQAYFTAWQGLPIKWEKQAEKRVAPHWKVVRNRRSPIAGTARHAVDPCNAMLNYAYACLESQCRQALIAYGFDTACGTLHTDQQGRDSLVYDLMELFRPQIDALVLTLIHQTVFQAGDMTLAQNGSIRFHPQFARYVIARCRLPQETIDQGARWLKQQVLASSEQEAAYGN